MQNIFAGADDIISAQNRQRILNNPLVSARGPRSIPCVGLFPTLLEQEAAEDVCGQTNMVCLIEVQSASLVTDKYNVRCSA